jgi:hypothetical protein
MTYTKLALAAILAPLLSLTVPVQAETVRDCTVTGTVKRASGSAENVYVALHSVKPAEEGANCKMRRREKLEFRLPASEELTGARPGTRVEYRYTEDSESGSSWKLQKVSER